MRILVVSDSHGDAYALQSAVIQQPHAEVVLFLGDGEQEFWQVKPQFPERMFLGVRGNGDWDSRLPVAEECTLEGSRFFFTHGHAYHVKEGLYSFFCAARERGAKVALFGHTHVPFTDYQDGVYLLNPGSLHGYGATYGVVDVTKAGVVTNLVKLR
jgi:putative phosphoesterase